MKNNENIEFKIGDKAILTDDFGKEHVVTITSKPYDMCCSTVIDTDLYRAYDIDRIKPLN